MELLNQVKPLYDQGFALLWLYPKSKRPIGDDWQTGPRKHIDILAKTFNERNNVGVRFGTPSKFKDNSYLCALDCDVKSSDPKHLKEMQAALMKFCPSHEFAPRVLSGRGGGSCHFYFRTRDPQTSFKALRSTQKVKVYMPSANPSDADLKDLSAEEIKHGYRMRLAWEVDVYGEGKQAVLPPSIHPDTMKAYQWETPLRDYEAIPLVKNFTPDKVKTVSVKGAPVNVSTTIEFEPVDLFTTAISEKAFGLITTGLGFEAFPSRSEALFSSLNSLVGAGLTNGQVYTVLTDPTNFMSEKPLEAAGRDRDPVRAARWLEGQLNKIRAENRAKDIFDREIIVDDMDEIFALTPEEIDAQEGELVHWSSKLHTTKQGDYKNTQYNVYMILKNSTDQSHAVFAYDEFYQGNFYTHIPLWGDKNDVGRELIDLDDVKIKTWLSRVWKVEVSTQTVADVALQIGKENSFHPVQRYLRSLKWDGVERLDTMLAKYAGAEGESKYLADVGRKFMVGAVARAFDAGCTFQHVLILEGEQGIGKSWFANILATRKDWFSDSLGDISSKDVIDNMRGKWVIEIGEMASMNRAESNDLKAFITRTHDVARKAYGRRSQTYPRQCVFIGTTNEDEYLKDVTGARRFWPVRTTHFSNKELIKVVDQLWAEAVACYDLGEALYLDDEKVKQYAELMQGQRYVVDELQTKVERIIEAEGFPELFGFDDVWGAMQIDPNKPCDMQTQIRIKKAIKILKYPKVRARFDDGERSYKWSKDKSIVGSYKQY